MSKGNGEPCKRCNSHDWDSRGSCKECARIRSKKWAAENKERAYAQSRKWYLKNKERFHELQAIYRANNKDGELARVKRWQQNNPDKVRINRKIRIERERKADGSHTHEEWLELLELYNNRCGCCGSDENVCKDHIIPVAHGGSHNIENIQPLCKVCNSVKGIKHTKYEP